MTKRTKRGLVIGFFAMVFICVSMTCLWAEETSIAPVMIIPEAIFDFGEVREGVTLEHTFTIQNKGGKVLTIKRVKPG